MKEPSNIPLDHEGADTGEVDADRVAELDNVLANQVNRMAVKGMPVLLEPDDAEMMGAVPDDSMDPADITASRFDHIDHAA